VLSDLDIEYFVGDSIASMIFGEPRLTMDADLVARVLGRHAPPLGERLQPACDADQLAIEAAVREGSSFHLIHLDTMAKVDVYVAWRSDFAHGRRRNLWRSVSLRGCADLKPADRPTELSRVRTDTRPHG